MKTRRKLEKMDLIQRLPKIGIQPLILSFLAQEMPDGQFLLPQEVQGRTGGVFGEHLRVLGENLWTFGSEAGGLWRERGALEPIEYRYESTIREAIGGEAKVFLSRWLASFAGVQAGPDQIEVLWVDNVETSTRVSWDIRLQCAGELFDVGGGIVSEAEF